MVGWWDGKKLPQAMTTTADIWTEISQKREESAAEVGFSGPINRSGLGTWSGPVPTQALQSAQHPPC